MFQADLLLDIYKCRIKTLESCLHVLHDDLWVTQMEGLFNLPKNTMHLKNLIISYLHLLEELHLYQLFPCKNKYEIP